MSRRGLGEPAPLREDRNGGGERHELDLRAPVLTVPANELVGLAEEVVPLAELVEVRRARPLWPT